MMDQPTTLLILQVKILKKHPDPIVPEYATKGASGLDLHARIPHDIIAVSGFSPLDRVVIRH